MSRITMTVENKSRLTVKCTNVKCEKFSNLDVGTTIAPGGKNTFNSDTSDRIFCTFEEEGGGIGAWQLGMTCPTMSGNNAQGSFNAGLQKYKDSGDLVVTYRLGTPNQAGWENENGPDDPSSNVRYGECS